MTWAVNTAWAKLQFDSENHAAVRKRILFQVRFRQIDKTRVQTLLLYLSKTFFLIDTKVIMWRGRGRRVFLNNIVISKSNTAHVFTQVLRARRMQICIQQDMNSETQLRGKLKGFTRYNCSTFSRQPGAPGRTLLFR